MPHWLIKSAIHRVISLMPQSQKCNEWFQERVTKSLELSPGAFEKRLEFCRRYLDDFLALRPDCADGFNALELGTGWYPIVTIGLYLCGAHEIWSFDIHPLLRRSRLATVLKYFSEYDRDGKLQKFLPVVRPDRIAKLREALQHLDTDTPAESLVRFNIHALIRDAQQTGLNPGTIDLFFSCAVFEYIPRRVQENLYAEFRRLATPGAVVIGYVSLWDEFSSFDKRLSPLNFLKYSSAAWKWFNSPLIPQTRLRIADYRAALVNSGYQIVKEVSNSAPPAQLDRICLAPEFRHYSREDLLVIDTWLVAQPTPGR
jgi:hypothetical protein